MREKPTAITVKLDQELYEELADEIDRILRKFAKQIGLERGYSAYSMRATFITTALDNGASLEDVQMTAREPVEE
jgi:site-specific recombinase XerD